MPSPSLKSTIESFVSFLATEKGYSQNTCRAYTRDLAGFFKYAESRRQSSRQRGGAGDEVDAAQVDSLTIRGYLGVLHGKNKKSTVARKLSSLRSYFRYLIKHGVISENPADLIMTPKQEKTIPVYLTVDEMFRLLDAIQVDTLLGLRNRAIFESLYSCGIRVSELAGLNVLDVDFKQRLIRVLGKGGKERIVPVGKKALAA